ncbi:glycine oxidase ThiO [Kribbella sandramycini]|uniref:glycine oxidase n=1 Tax=Kribbella sandramycini TaxID=60450 RepID=A0A7Y4NXL8_9ACTN|nr:glycine oxidase ThiO [Kribbella sandramycini]MBB6568544.1 glycine oxidase [Kribbella sandramycini]NOL38868.1 glycine oxidase ThiO [Kribbella sandramycini]
MPEHTSDVVVIGAGLIGLATAWQLAADGLQVTLCDPAPATQTSTVAAGMLAPVTEVEYGEDDLLALNLAGVNAWPDFAARLEDATGVPAGLHRTGTLSVAYDVDDAAALRRLAEYQRTLGLEVEVLTGRESRKREPLLANGVSGGVWVPGDHSVDNRQALTALLRAVEVSGVSLIRQRVAQVLTAGTTAIGVQLDDGTAVHAGQVIAATGPWSAQLKGVPDELRAPVRPVKGEVLRLRVPEAYRPALNHTVRATARGFAVYLVPRPGGELVVGATSNELGYDTRVLAGGVFALLRDARTVLPVIDELELMEAIAGLRPATPDNAPILGPSGLDGLLWATGHYRNGVLLTPVTAAILSATVRSGTLPDLGKPFLRSRFGHF